MKGIKKWLAVFRVGLIQSLAFRAEVFLWILLDMFPTVILAITWTAIFQGKTLIGGHTLSQLLMYYLAILVIVNLSEVHFEERWVEKVRYGKIDYHFVKPISLPAYIFIQALGSKVIGFFSFAVPFSIFLYTLVSLRVLSLAMLSLPHLALFSLFIIAAFLFDTILSFFVVLAAFWIDEASSFGHFKWMVMGVFGGSLAPLAFYPAWLQRVAAFLPFKYALATPASILTQPTIQSSTFVELGIFIVYIALFSWCAAWMWNRAKLKYTSAGG